MSNDSANDKTIAAYESHAEAYTAGSPHQLSAETNGWIDRALAQIPPGSTVLELGSGFGRDADYIESKGYHVELTDAAKAFVKLLREQGHQARVLNAITDELGGSYAIIFANAVLLHFTDAAFKTTLAKIYAALHPGGIFAFSLQEGAGSAWSDRKLGVPRYFNYWTTETVRPLLAAARFEILELSVDTTDQRQEIRWLRITARKSS